MGTILNSRRHAAIRFSYALAAVLIAALLSGCSASYGRFRDDPQVASQFQTGALPSSYTYYWYGNGNNFYAIAGLDPNITLQSSLWRKIAPGSEEFKEAVNFIWEDYGFRSYGAAILDPDGKRVGIWFSSLRYVTAKFVGNQELALIPDAPFLWGPGAWNGSGPRGPSG